MTLTEFVFQVRSEKSLLCAYTRERRDTQVVIHLLRPAAGGEVREGLYTILGPRRSWQGLLQDFQREHGAYRVVAEHDQYVSVQAPLKLEYMRGHNPITAVVDTFGPDCWFHPLLVKDGYLHISFVSPNEAGRERFMAYAKRMREHVSPDDFRLVHVGPYAAPALATPREGLTPGQDEVLNMAVALGYYDTPRGCTVEDLAEAFGISKAAAHKRLKAAENKVIKDFAGRRG